MKLQIDGHEVLFLGNLTWLTPSGSFLYDPANDLAYSAEGKESQRHQVPKSFWLERREDASRAPPAELTYQLLGIQEPTEIFKRTGLVLPFWLLLPLC